MAKLYHAQKLSMFCVQAQQKSPWIRFAMLEMIKAVSVVLVAAQMTAVH